MKKLCVTVILILLMNTLPVFAADGIKLSVNGETVKTDVGPVIYNSRTLVPARAVLEALGADVSWDEKTKKVSVSEYGCEITMYAESAEASVNGENVKLDCPAKIIGGRIMIPVRFVAENLGADVSWDEAARVVKITKKMYSLTLRNVTAAADGDYLKITAAFDDEVGSFSDFKLSNDGKNRVVVDINDCSVGNAPSSVNVGINKVKAVRTGQFKASPYVTRIVADLTAASEYTVEKNGKNLVIKIENKNTANDSVALQPEKPSGSSAASWDGSVKLSDKAKNLLVYVDAGHGGSETGAIGNKGTANEIYEKDINLAISLYLNDMLKQAGIKTAMTRTDDSYVSLYDRPVKANNLGADLFLSVHSNSFKNDIAEGTETLYYANGGDSYGISSEEFAELIQKEVTAALSTFDRGCVNGSEMYVIRKSAMPAVIAEIAFVSNTDDLAKLSDKNYQKKAAYALCRATIKALNIMAEKRG